MNVHLISSTEKPKISCSPQSNQNHDIRPKQFVSPSSTHIVTPFKIFESSNNKEYQESEEKERKLCSDKIGEKKGYQIGRPNQQLFKIARDPKESRMSRMKNKVVEGIISPLFYGDLNLIDHKYWECYEGESAS